MKSSVDEKEVDVPSVKSGVDEKTANVSGVKSSMNEKEAKLLESLVFSAAAMKTNQASSDFMTEFLADLDTPPFIQRLLQDYATPPESPNHIEDDTIKTTPLLLNPLTISR